MEWPALPFSQLALMTAVSASAVWVLLPLMVRPPRMSDWAYLITVLLFWLNSTMALLSFSIWLSALK
jgi:hypothetical protein